jgi:hypothetical protein
MIHHLPRLLDHPPHPSDRPLRMIAHLLRLGDGLLRLAERWKQVIDGLLHNGRSCVADER